MENKRIYIDGVNVKDCKRRIGKDNFCRYYKRPCAENNYNCIWKKYLRKELECEELKTILAEIKEIAENVQSFVGRINIEDDVFEQMEQILTKISEMNHDL